jgi:hypothetical protein
MRGISVKVKKPSKPKLRGPVKVGLPKTKGLPKPGATTASILAKYL